MKNRVYFTLITGGVCAVLAGCGAGSKALRQSSVSVIEEVATLPDAEIVIPAGLVGDEIQDSGGMAQGNAQMEGEDDSDNMTFSLTGEERTQIVNQISKEVEDSIASILSDQESYPNIVAITPNAGCTEFTISLRGGQMNTYESMLVLSFFTAGNKYQIYCGTPADEAKTVVKYVNDATGEVVSESDSTLMSTQ